MLTRSVKEIRGIKRSILMSEATDARDVIDATGIIVKERIDLAQLVAVAYKLGKADAVAEARAKRRAVSV